VEGIAVCNFAKNFLRIRVGRFVW